MTVIKLVANSGVINSTASNFGLSKLVWVFNSGAAVANVAVRNTADVVTFALVPANTHFAIEKGPTDTLESNNNSTVFGTPIAYRN
jgi:hypothetical protein